MPDNFNNTNQLPIALFHRSYQSYTGGHGKVWDYFNHIKQSGLYQTKIYFTPDSVFDKNNPWINSEDVISTWEPQKADLLFLAGLDWGAIPDNFPKGIPVINLIQHVRHADPNLYLYRYLKNKAIRICVSQPVADSILSTGQVNGPVFVIPNGIDISLQLYVEKKSTQIFIGALKKPELGFEISQQLMNAGYQIDLLIDKIPRKEYLLRLQNAQLAILLPNQFEGFYLPGLEAMALGTPVIMTDCGGNKEYAKHNHNCLLVPPDKIPETVWEVTPELLKKIVRAGIETAKKFTLERERLMFIDTLKNNNKIWINQ